MENTERSGNNSSQLRQGQKTMGLLTREELGGLWHAEIT